MFLSSITVLLAISSHVFGHSADVGDMPSPRIYGGSMGRITDTPWTVVLLTDLNYNFCVGTILAPRKVLTTAYCVPSGSYAGYKVRTGSPYTDVGGQVVDIAVAVVHDKYNATSRENDIAIYYLSSDILMGPTAAAVKLPIQGQPIADNVMGIMVGWGLSESQKPSTFLRALSIPVVNTDMCQRLFYNEDKNVNDGMLCAGYVYMKGDNLALLGGCNLDEGAPLTSNGMLIGIFSWTKYCGQLGYPSVFTKIPDYKTWIDEH